MSERPGRVLGVDPGTVRVGLAVCDPDRIVATPLRTVAGGDGITARIAAAAEEVDARTIVVGLPRSLSGRDTASTRMARSLARELSGAGFEVHLQDERLTSVQADRALRASGRNSKTTRPVKDQLAAAMLLQSWLDRQR